MRNEWAKKIDMFRDNKMLATVHVLDEIQQICFREMYLSCFMPFKNSPKFEELELALKHCYNRVDKSDFEYICKLGIGGFGRVVHVRKKSTGKHYAMKIQLKSALVNAFLDHPDQLHSEKVRASPARCWQLKNCVATGISRQQLLTAGSQCKLIDIRARFLPSLPHYADGLCSLSSSLHN